MTRAPLNGGTAAAVTADERKRIADLVVAELDRRALADRLRRLAELLSPEPTTWLRKTDAARELGTTVDTVRGLCKRQKLRTTWLHDRELVDLEDLRRVLASRQTTATDRIA